MDAGLDGDARAAQGLDEQRPREAGRLVHRADAHQRPGADRDLAAHREALRPDALRFEPGAACPRRRCPPGRRSGRRRSAAGTRPSAGSPALAAGVTSTSTRLSLTRIGVTTSGPLPLPCDRAKRRSSISTSPSTCLMPLSLTCRARSLRPARGSASVSSVRGAEPVGVDVIVVLEEELAVGVAAAAEGEVALGHEDEVAVQPAAGHVAAAVDGRLEAVVGAEGRQGGGAGVELGDGGGGEEHVGVVFVDGAAAVVVHDEEAPAAVLVVGAVDDGVDLGGEAVVGADGAATNAVNRAARRGRRRRERGIRFLIILVLRCDRLTDSQGLLSTRLARPAAPSHGAPGPWLRAAAHQWPPAISRNLRDQCLHRERPSPVPSGLSPPGRPAPRLRHSPHGRLPTPAAAAPAGR